MAQIKIYGLAERLNPVKDKVSAAIHACVVEGRTPEAKRHLIHLLFEKLHAQAGINLQGCCR